MPTYESWDNARNPYQAQPEPQAQPTAPAQSQTQPQPQAQFQAEPQSQAQPGSQSHVWFQAQQQQQAAPQAPQVIYAAPPTKRGHGWIVALVLVVCLFAFTAFCVKSCSDVLSSAAFGSISSGPTDDSIAVIDIGGTIQYDGTACSPEGLKSLLDQAADNNRIKGVVLRVNSGGGTATAGEEMAEYIREFREDSGKPVVVSSASINASAAYEISSQASYIYVAKSTEIGSIGTAMEVTDLSGLLDMLGVDIDVITSADSKDSSYGYRPLTEEERGYYQAMIDQINGIFIENVASGRGMEVDKVRELATGLAFTGIDAVENGLADEIGTLEDAGDKAAELAGVADYDFFRLSLSSYNLSSLYDLLGSYEGDNQISFPLLKQ